MAINFETVTGNQSSANVLAQINNNFAKINSSPVPKAEFATNADTVDNKHASELIPGAATFLDSITSLANLSIGRYFCTQTRQSWEPVTTTGSRTFLIEVSLNTPKNLKNYKINYIAGAGAGESYYSDYSSGSIKWNRIVNDKNLGNFESIKNTYDDKDRAGRITTYKNLITYEEEGKFENGSFIPVGDGTGNFYTISSSDIEKSYIPSESCNSAYYIVEVQTILRIYNSNYDLIKTITSTTNYSKTGTPGTANSISAVFINKDTGDAIIGNTGATSGYYYFSYAAQKLYYISFSPAWNNSSFNPPTYWYQNHFGILQRWSDRLSSSAYSTLQNYYVDLTADRSGVAANNSSGISSSAYYYTLIGQKGQYYYFITNAYSGNPTVTRYNIVTKATNGDNINVSISNVSMYGLLDDDYIYIMFSNYIYKYNLSLVLVTSVSNSQDLYQQMLTKNYILRQNSGTIYAYNKSNLALVGTYTNSFTNYYTNNSYTRKWYSSEIADNASHYGICIKDDLVLGNPINFYFGVQGNNSYTGYSQLPAIFNASNGTIDNYLGNNLFYIDNSNTTLIKNNLGLIYRNIKLNVNIVNYILTGFVLK